MQKKKIIANINAHIENIRFSIDPTSSKITVSFDNLGYGNITAIKFKAKGYNSFGDVITVNDSDTFYLIAQDLHIPKNTSAGNIKIPLPNCEIRKLELEEHQICFDDGSVCTYEGCQYREFEVYEYEDEGEDSETLLVLKARFGDQYQYAPREFDCGWICCCGSYNPTERTTCQYCNLQKEVILQAEDEAMVKQWVAEYRLEEREKLEQEKRKKEAKRRKTIIIYTAVFSVILLLLLLPLLFAKMQSSGNKARCPCQSADYTDDIWKKLSTTVTCTEAGSAQFQCLLCGETKTFDSIPAKGHEYEMIGDTATCTVDGEKFYECINCPHEYSEPSVASHDWEYQRKDVTCLCDGYKYFYCTKCNETRKDFYERSPTYCEYKYKDTIIDKSKKYKRYECSVCKKTKLEEVSFGYEISTSHEYFFYCTTAAEDYVTQFLNYPLNSTFPSHNYMKVYKSANEYTCVGYVDASNAFGVKERKYFAVTMTISLYGEKFSYSVIDFEIY